MRSSTEVLFVHHPEIPMKQCGPSWICLLRLSLSNVSIATLLWNYLAFRLQRIYGISLPLNKLNLVLDLVYTGSPVYMLTCSLEIMWPSTSLLSKRPIITSPTQSLLFSSLAQLGFYFLCYIRTSQNITHRISSSKAHTSWELPYCQALWTLFLMKSIIRTLMSPLLRLHLQQRNKVLM